MITLDEKDMEAVLSSRHRRRHERLHDFAILAWMFVTMGIIVVLATPLDYWARVGIAIAIFIPLVILITITSPTKKQTQAFLKECDTDTHVLYQPTKKLDKTKGGDINAQ